MLYRERESWRPVDNGRGRDDELCGRARISVIELRAAWQRRRLKWRLAMKAIEAIVLGLVSHSAYRFKISMSIFKFLKLFVTSSTLTFYHYIKGKIHFTYL
jgi:hypothetical protein